MAQIPRAALDFLTGQVNAISADAQAKVLEVLEAIEWTPDNVARCREIVAEALASVLPAYADASAQAAADFYDSARELCAGEAIGAAALSGLDIAAVQGAVRALVQVVVDGGAKERFDREVLGRVDVEMKKAAANSIVENAAKDPAKPRWARVPSGRETCPFCLMLASFGFNTGSKEAASHTHANCDCRIVPQWGDGSVEGYDPDGMYDRYGACLDSIGGRDGVRREWNALPKGEREAYIAKHGDRAGEAFDAFLNKRVSAEIGRRDPEWFRTGVPSKPSSDRVAFSGGQVGKKFGKHCGDWGLDPASREDRDAMMGIIKSIIDEADRVDIGEWRGQVSPCTFCLKGNDLVIIDPYNEFVTVMKGGGDNKRYKGAIGADGP